jgi:TRAP-type C4-dicarboxylate transport system substrate-binding protein
MLNRVWVGALVGLVCALAGAAAQAATVLRIGTVAPEGSRYAKDLKAIGQDIERLTGGEVTVKYFFSARLGDEKRMAQMVLDPEGQLDGVGFTGVGLTFLVPEMKIWVYPGMFQSYAEVDFLENRYRAEFEGYYDKAGLVLVTWANVGFNYIYAADKIDTWEVLKTRRLWLWADDDVVLAAAAMIGVKTDATSLAGLQDWLREKKIDVWVYPPLAVVGMGLQGYVRYVSDMPFNYLAGGFVLRKDVWATLSPSAQRAIMSVGEKWEARLIKSWRAENDRALKAMQKQGAKLVTWSPDEREKFFQETAKERGTFAKKWGLESLMRRFTDDLDKFRKSK